ncbi:MAG: hypothetical protein V1897_17105 [Pseudomonadota bacterium]
MALRVVAIFAFLTTLFFTFSIVPGIAGGPPMEVAPYCAPAPCAPPTCGPMGPPSPFGICGALLGACTNICGAAIGIPSAIMAGILAPAPKLPIFRRNFCAPPPCAPPVCQPPVCGPPVCGPAPCVPAGITKCKPPRSYIRQGAVSNPSTAPYPIMMAMPARASYDLKSDLPGGLKIVASIMEVPLNLVSGRLVSTDSGPLMGQLAGSRHGQTALTGQYW